MRFMNWSDPTSVLFSWLRRHWSGMTPITILQAAEPIFGCDEYGAEGDNGSLAVTKPEVTQAPAPEKRLFDDDVDSRSREEPSLLRRAHAMTRGGDDIIPTF